MYNVTKLYSRSRASRCKFPLLVLSESSKMPNAQQRFTTRSYQPQSNVVQSTTAPHRIASPNRAAQMSSHSLTPNVYHTQHPYLSPAPSPPSPQQCNPRPPQRRPPSKPSRPPSTPSSQNGTLRYRLPPPPPASASRCKSSKTHTSLSTNLPPSTPPLPQTSPPLSPSSSAPLPTPPYPDHHSHSPLFPST